MGEKINETVADIFVRRMDFLGMTNVVVAEKLLFGTPNVISLIRKGRMKLPLDRVVLAAKLFEIDPIYLMRVMAQENEDDRLLEVVEVATGQEPLTEAEWELVKLYRKRTHNKEVDLHVNFPDEWAMIDLALEDVEKKVKRDDAAFAARRVVKKGPTAGYKRNRPRIEIDDPAQDQLTPEQALAKAAEQEAAELKALAAAARAESEKNKSGLL